MATERSTTEDAAERDETLEQSQELRKIDALIRQCQNRLSDVSNGLISSATKDATMKMYRELRQEAERTELRSQRLEWMEGNVGLLQKTIEKAAREREFFEADLARGVAQKWMSAASAAKWMRKFEDPSLLEMTRSMWIKEEWAGFKKRWQALAKDRDAVEKKFAASGLTKKDVPEIAALENDEQFFSDERSYHTRRSLVDTVDALITAAGQRKTVLVRQAETLLLSTARGANRCMHPSKVGQWLQRMVKSGNPEQFRTTVILPFIENWKDARAQYDGLAARYAAEGKPEGCAPMTLNAFLELPYDARVSVLGEWGNRLESAKRSSDAESTELENAKRGIRRSIDLQDLDAAEASLDALRIEHTDDADVRSITRHLAVLRAEQAKKEDTREESERTADAHEELEAMHKGVPTAIAAHYAYLLENGDTAMAETLFRSMKVRADRLMSGRTSHHDEFLATLEAEEVEEAEVVPEVTEQEEEPEESQLLVSQDTPPSTTIALLKAQDQNRSPALVIEGMPHEQQLQLVRLNERTLANMRHLDRVGERYKAKKDPVAA